MKNKVEQDGNLFRFKCPHCSMNIEVETKQTNCRIFRCGIIKSNMKQIPPHTKKPQCDDYVNKNLIFGCSAPFRFIYHKDGNYVESCGYI